MRNNILVASALAATAIMFVAGCSSNQSIKTTDGKTIVTSGKPQVDDDTGLVLQKCRNRWSRLTAIREIYG
jgi:uncharacterized protein YcfL